MIIIEEEKQTEPPAEKCYYMKSDLRNEAKKDFWMGQSFDHTNPDHHEELAKKMEEVRKGQ
jgi:hypothetical protein